MLWPVLAAARDHIPEVVEPTVRVLGIQARPLRSDGNDALVDEDERVHQRVRDRAGRQGLEDIETHHRTDMGVLDEDDLALRCGDLCGHGVLLLSLC